VKILAVETSGLEASVALADGSELLSERALDTAGRRNARLLVPAVDELLRKQDWQPSDVDVVAVSIGPGSFTGLRVGVVFAKTYAWINDTKLVAVDTLQAIAQRSLPTEPDITVISDAQRGDLFVNSYHAEDIAQPIGNVRIESLDQVLAEYSGQLLTGPGIQKFAEQIPPDACIAEAENQEPRAAALLLPACDMIQRQAWADPDTLEPVYLRRSYAEESADRSS